MAGARILGLGFVAAVASGSCSRDMSFACTDDDQCRTTTALGRCEANGWCSYPAGECRSGWQYDEAAGDGLDNQCVPVGDGSGSGSGSSSTTKAPTTSMGSTSAGPTAGSSTTVAITSGSTSAGQTGGPIEVCDGLDNDGDGLVDEWSSDNTDVCAGCSNFQTGDFAYKRCDRGVDWDAAVQRCADVGFTLASVVDSTEDLFIRGVVRFERSWIGGSDLEGDGTFEWVDGSPFAFAGWAPSEPGPPAPNRCIQARDDGWHSDACNDSESFVCKAPHTP